MRHEITPQMAFRASSYLSSSADHAKLAFWLDKHSNYLAEINRENCLIDLEKAALTLGYRLVPLTQDKPDSGRPSIPETEPAQKENCNG